MNIAVGLKAHSGWAALVALGTKGDDELEVVDRRRIELVGHGAGVQARQPYHAAEGLSSSEAKELVRRGVRSAHEHATRELQAAVSRAQPAWWRCGYVDPPGRLRWCFPRTSRCAGCWRIRGACE